ncbi:MAG: hypothetical protein AAGE96_03545 [Cyanobacteria bacterium P01_G01_bin.19]
MKSLLTLCLNLFVAGSVFDIEANSNINRTINHNNFPVLIAQIQTSVSPLIQSGKNFLSLEQYELESIMEITGDIPGRSFISDAKIKTIVEAPNKFNSQIAFVSPNGLEGKSYKIISDGDLVWIYDFATNQYSVSELRQFLQTREGLLAGTLSYFYLNTRNNIGSSKIIASFLAKLPEDRLLRYFQRYNKLNLQNSVIKNETINDKTYQVYDIDALDRGFQVKAFVNPQENSIERIHLSGTKDGLELASQERVTNLTIPESISPETFVFIPPDEAEQVEQQITIAPF